MTTATQERGVSLATRSDEYLLALLDIVGAHIRDSRGSVSDREWETYDEIQAELYKRGL